MAWLRSTSPPNKSGAKPSGGSFCRVCAAFHHTSAPSASKKTLGGVCHCLSSHLSEMQWRRSHTKRRDRTDCACFAFPVSYADECIASSSEELDDSDFDFDEETSEEEDFSSEDEEEEIDWDTCCCAIEKSTLYARLVSVRPVCSTRLRWVCLTSLGSCCANRSRRSLAVSTSK